MESSLLESLKNLYDQELYSSVVELANLVLTVSERCPPDAMSPQQKYQLLLYYADALYQTQRFKKAEQIYMKSLQHRRLLSKSSPEVTKPLGATSSVSVVSILEANLSENEVKYRLHVCLVRQQKFKEALGVLESIPPKSRAAKVSYSLACLYQQLGHGMEKMATEGFREVLKQFPMALDAASQLLTLGMKLDEVNAVISSATTCSGKARQSHFQATFDSPYMDWLPFWLKGQAALACRDYGEAIKCFKELDSSSMIANNTKLLSDLGKAYYAAGESSKSIMTLQRVNSLDSLYTEGMDILAALLCEEKRIKELESLATRLMADDDQAAQSLVAMGYLCKILKKAPHALYLAHKAVTISGSPQPNVEALLLKALILLEGKKYTEAAIHFTEALEVSPYRFELHEGLVNCCLERQKTKEALAAGQNCLKLLGASARSLTLYASVLAKDPHHLGKAQSLLERAVASAPHLLNAVYLLVDIYNTQGQYDRAIAVLRQQANLHVKSKLHQMLGDFLSKSNRPTEALDRYRFALSLDPENLQAITGMSSLEEMKATSSTDAYVTPEVNITTVPPDAPAAPSRGRLFVNNDNDDSMFDIDNYR